MNRNERYLLNGENLSTKLSYFFIKLCMKLRIYVLDYSFETVPGTGADDGALIANMVIEGRWFWQKRSV